DAAKFFTLGLGKPARDVQTVPPRRTESPRCREVRCIAGPAPAVTTAETLHSKRAPRGGSKKSATCLLPTAPATFRLCLPRVAEPCDFGGLHPPGGFSAGV